MNSLAQVSTSPVDVVGAGAVRHVVLNRPERHNAQDRPMWDALAKAGASLANDATVRVVVVRGNGPSFSSGLDLSQLQPGGELHAIAHTPPEEEVGAIDSLKRLQRTFLWMRDAPFITIAAIHGSALGAGFQLALACDLRTATAEASLSLPETLIGAVPDLGAMWVLPRLIGYERSLEFIASGRTISGGEAAELGLILRAVPADQLTSAVDDLASGLSDLPRPVIRTIKRALNSSSEAESLSIAASGQVEALRAALVTTRMET